MKKAFTAALLGTAFALSACGGDAVDETTAEEAAALPEVAPTGATMTGTEDDTSAAGAGVDTGAMPIGGGTGSATDSVVDAATGAATGAPE